MPQGSVLRLLLFPHPHSSFQVGAVFTQLAKDVQQYPERGFRLSQLSVCTGTCVCACVHHWYVVGRGQGCCSTLYNVKIYLAPNANSTEVEIRWFLFILWAISFSTAVLNAIKCQQFPNLYLQPKVSTELMTPANSST